MKDAIIKWVAVVTLLVLPTACSVPQPLESESTPTDSISMPEIRVEESTEPESPADMGSYVTENTQLPDHFDVDAIQENALEVAQAVADIYREMDYHDGYELTWLPTDAELYSIYEIIGSLGYPVVMDEVDTLNPDQILHFCQQVEHGESDSLGVFVLEGYGHLSYHCFTTENGDIYNTRVQLNFGAGGTIEMPEIAYENHLDHFFFTDKGFMIYGNIGTGWAGLAQGFRVSPLGENLRRLNQTYVQPLGGLNGHNILVEEWDGSSLDSLSYNDVFEILYQYEYGVSPDKVYEHQYTPSVVYVKAVPRADFESIMLKYFDVDANDLRSWAVYDAEQEVYAWEMYISNQYQPSWEVVDFTENADGSLTLAVDAYSIRHYQDHIATCYLTVMPRTDGTFYYLSNRIESGEEMKWFPIYTPRQKR